MEERLLIYLCFDDVIEFDNCGSCSNAAYVKGHQYIFLTQKEYTRLLNIKCKFRIGHKYEGGDRKILIDMKIITDPNLIHKINGIEDVVSTHKIYKYIRKDKYYQNKYTIPEEKLEAIINNGPHLDFRNFCDLITEKDDWDERIALALMGCIKLGENLIPKLLRRLAYEFPQMCNMTILAGYYESDLSELIDFLIKAGKSIDECDTWSEECNLMGYAVITENLDRMQQIYKKGTDLQIKFKDGSGLLELAYKPETVKWLIDHGVSSEN